ncbi:MAG: hypothetical protein Q8N16_03705 [bacterium]|nr:hypothetical protein [bacterium]
MNNKAFLIFLISILLLGFAPQALALEIVYPDVPGMESPQEFMPKIKAKIYPSEYAVPLFVKYFYGLALILGSLIAGCAIVFGGVLYLTAGANIGRTVAARDQMTSALTGLLLLLCSFMLLKVINPSLLFMRLSAVSHPSPSMGPLPSINLEKPAVFWELPIGTIEISVIEKMKQTKAPAEALKEASIIVTEKSQELKDLLDTCKCSRLDSECDDDCVAAPDCEGTFEELCPKKAQIDSKRLELSAALEVLKAKRLAVIMALMALYKESGKLGLAKNFLENSQGHGIDFYTFQSIKDEMNVVVKKIWGPGSGSGSLICSGSPSPISLPPASGSCKLSNAGVTFWSVPRLSDLPTFQAIVEAAAETFHVPPSLMLGVMYGEGAFNPGRYTWTNENIENWSCEGGGMPNCDPSVFPSQGIVPFQAEYIWNSLKGAVNEVAPGRVPNPCNLLDATFAVAKHLSRGALGSKDPGYDFTGTSCFGIPLNAGHSVHTTDCSWDQRDFQTAIKVWESGYLVDVCLSKTGGCAGGGGMAAKCPIDDQCEHYHDCFTGPGGWCSSHPYCIWSVTNFYK